MAKPVELSVSNICWPDGQAAHDEAIKVLADMEVPAIDVAPTKAWPRINNEGPESVDRIDIEDFTRTLRGRKIAGFQSLTYGVDGEIFTGDSERFRALSDRMRGVIDLAARAGASTVIYGSPKTRQLPIGMTRLGAILRGQEFFGPLAAHAYSRGVILGIEPVSEMYVVPGFGQSGRAVYEFTDSFNDPDASYTPPVLVPDTFAMDDSYEDVWHTIRAAGANARLAPHWQVSERGMGPVGGETNIDHAAFSAALQRVAEGIGYDGQATLLTRREQGGMQPYDGPITVAIEMDPRQYGNMSAVDALVRAVSFVRSTYPVVQ